MVPMCQNSEMYKTPIQTYSVPVIMADGIFFFEGGGWLLGRWTSLPGFMSPQEVKELQVSLLSSTLWLCSCHQTFFQDLVEKYTAMLSHFSVTTHGSGITQLCTFLSTIFPITTQRASTEELTALERCLLIIAVTYKNRLRDCIAWGTGGGTCPGFRS